MSLDEKLQALGSRWPSHTFRSKNGNILLFDGGYTPGAPDTLNVDTLIIIFAAYLQGRHAGANRQARMMREAMQLQDKYMTRPADFDVHPKDFKEASVPHFAGKNPPYDRKW